MALAYQAHGQRGFVGRIRRLRRHPAINNLVQKCNALCTVIVRFFFFSPGNTLQA